MALRSSSDSLGFARCLLAGSGLFFGIGLGDGSIDLLGAALDPAGLAWLAFLFFNDVRRSLLHGSLATAPALDQLFSVALQLGFDVRGDFAVVWALEGDGAGGDGECSEEKSEFHSEVCLIL